VTNFEQTVESERTQDFPKFKCFMENVCRALLRHVGRADFSQRLLWVSARKSLYYCQ